MSSKQNYSKLKKKNYNIKQQKISAYGEISNTTEL